MIFQAAVLVCATYYPGRVQKKRSTEQGIKFFTLPAQYVYPPCWLCFVSPLVVNSLRSSCYHLEIETPVSFLPDLYSQRFMQSFSHFTGQESGTRQVHWLHGTCIYGTMASLPSHKLLRLLPSGRCSVCPNYH